ncbi:hypothetical protein [Capnocytophaga sputigena]|uniref:hypothetical protein n=1 Tax=Capnocytophaga sputigena TaxID=1019 RepID=UPI0028E73B72|nr:hypothetical protein [Capnocytophaga sputigena]
MKTLFIPYTKKRTILKSLLALFFTLIILLLFFIYLIIDRSAISAGKEKVAYAFVLLSLLVLLGMFIIYAIPMFASSLSISFNDKGITLNNEALKGLVKWQDILAIHFVTEDDNYKLQEFHQKIIIDLKDQNTSLITYRLIGKEYNNTRIVIPIRNFKNDISDELGSIIDYILDNTDRFIAAKSDYGIVLADKTKVVIEEVEEED